MDLILIVYNVYFKIKRSYVYKDISLFVEYLVNWYSFRINAVLIYLYTILKFRSFRWSLRIVLLPFYYFINNKTINCLILFSLLYKFKYNATRIPTNNRTVLHHLATAVIVRCSLLFDWLQTIPPSRSAKETIATIEQNKNDQFPTMKKLKTWKYLNL